MNSPKKEEKLREKVCAKYIAGRYKDGHLKATESRWGCTCVNNQEDYPTTERRQKRMTSPAYTAGTCIR